MTRATVIFTLVSLSSLVSGHPWSRLGNHHEIHDVYDYILVGGGTAGLTVADRLSESGECKSIPFSFMQFH